MRVRPALATGAALLALTACGSTVQQRFPVDSGQQGGSAADSTSGLALGNGTTAGTGGTSLPGGSA